MRAVLVVAAVLACTSGVAANDCATVFAHLFPGERTIPAMPPAEAQRPPSVGYEIDYVPRDFIAQQCNPLADHRGKKPEGCTVNAPLPSDPSHRIILVDELLSDQETACIEIYEESHLPPNNWQDWRVEYWLNGPH